MMNTAVLWFVLSCKKTKIGSRSLLVTQQAATTKTITTTQGATGTAEDCLLKMSLSSIEEETTIDRSHQR